MEGWGRRWLGLEQKEGNVRCYGWYCKIVWYCKMVWHGKMVCYGKMVWYGWSGAVRRSGPAQGSRHSISGALDDDESSHV